MHTPIDSVKWHEGAWGSTGAKGLKYAQMRTAPPGGGWEASGGAGTAGGGEALAGVPREKWLYISYTYVSRM